MEEAMKLCINCIHYRPCPWTDGKCGALSAVSIVTGKTEQWYCRAARMGGHLCGPDAKLFEPINTQEAA
jgi:hypothetical protein